MEVQSSVSGFWWLKSSKSADQLQQPGFMEQEQPEGLISSTPRDADDTPTISSSLKEFLERERALQSPDDTDIGSIIEEINKLAAQSPLGPYEKDVEERSVEEIMKEAEKIYMESSKSFEQLSIRSRTSANLSVSFNDSAKSTPTPKSGSPLPLDSDRIEKETSWGAKREEGQTYSDDFTQISEGASKNVDKESREELEVSNCERVADFMDDNQDGSVLIPHEELLQAEDDVEEPLILEQEAAPPDEDVVKAESNEVRSDSNAQSFFDLEKALAQLKDSEATNTALRSQLNNLNEAHRLLKLAYDDLLTSNKQLEARAIRVESELAECEETLRNTQKQRDQFLENERNLQERLETEKGRVNTAKLQNEKDARCISDLNRQVKEMERIIARKHPDSVSALIVAAKDDHLDSNLTARKVLEDRIKALENEVTQRDRTSSKVFLEVQEKFDEMKKKYESHIEDLELHVNDLKSQLKRRNDTFDVYTQTFCDDQKIPSKETHDVSVQTSKLQLIPPQKAILVKKSDVKEDARLLATIRGLQADLVNKDKVAVKLQRELEEVKKTNKRLQKEREGNLKNLADRRMFQAGYSEKISFVRVQSGNGELEEELRAVRTERDKMKVQLCRMEEDYQNLKAKRLFDLSTLQRAHEEEMKDYVMNIESLQEQVKHQQNTINNLQDQLRRKNVPLNMISVPEKEDVNSNSQFMSVLDEVSLAEQHKQEWCRLTTILHGLSQRNAEDRSCAHCETRQKELINYKKELDQLLASVRKLT